MKRPDYLEQGHLEYLDMLRDSGETNMFGASIYLTGEMGMTGLEDVELLSYEEAIEVLSYWMKTFDKRHSN